MTIGNTLTLKQLSLKEGTRALVRIDVNEPIEDGELTDDFRLVKIMPTLHFLQKKKLRVILIAHHSDSKQTLKPAFKRLSRVLPVTFYSESFVFNEKYQPAQGEFLMLDNLRFHKGEEKNDQNFAFTLSKWGDIYINEAFSASHREHASIVGLPRFLPSFFGFQFEKEVENLKEAFNPQRPSIVILGGAKSETKVPLIRHLIGKIDKFFIGGATAIDFLAADNKIVSKSAYSQQGVILAREILSRFREKIFLPKTIVTETGDIKSISSIEDNDVIKDVGLNFIDEINKSLKGAQFVIWNGPLGHIEQGFSASTRALAEILSRSSARVVLGGGDTLAILKKLGLRDKFWFVSLGGGAMLEFLSTGTLPGIEAIIRSESSFQFSPGT
jgi:phosphoglycerate kinase